MPPLRLIRRALVPAPLHLSARRRLLESIVSRGSSEVAAVTIPGLLAWAGSRFTHPAALLAWWAALVVLAGVMFALRRQFRAALAREGDAAVVRWERVFEWLALATGVSWAVPLALTLDVPSYEFKLLLYFVLSAVIASASTFLATMPGVFGRFFVACFVPMVVLAVPAFPGRWPVILPLMLLYGAVICRHAWGTRQFVRQQFVLERERADLADQYRAARDLAEHALAEKDRFLSTASHDLRQPVHAMGMLVESALARNTDAGLAPVLQDVQRCARSLTAMFDALLDLSRIEAGTFATTRAAVSVRELFDEAATVFGSDAAGRGLALRLWLPRRREAVVAGDPTLLRQVLFNLLQNALRYTPRGGVLVAARWQAGRWRLEVWDTGTGVAVEDQARIYSPFYRSAQPHARASAGHGLGLAVVARSAELMEAGYGFHTRPGRGSCFWVALPAAASAPAVVPGPVAASPRLAGRCLLVDDDPAVGLAWRGLFETWGLATRVARDGREAFQCVADGFVPDAILCDQRLAGGDSGFAVLRALLDRCPGARGAMVSGEFDSPALAQAEEEGYLVFRKPVAPAALHAVLSRWLAAA